jgi:2-polyprenyl-3-methyl-5-hydroxy-6-metoxy-1,4-benzoquinol methylase/predicted  nucleic acid-binding Zn-ribbon protein
MDDINNEKSLARDKIAQVYLGEMGSELFQTRVRNRINWIVDQIDHGSVLDIGCSEGILPILIGRKGVDVTGVDINPESIAYAKNLLGKENLDISSHVTFICADILHRDWQGITFEVVILGEIIEHFSQPELILEKAISLLKPGGTLIVTTPFGFLPDPDHHFTFTLSTFIDYFRKYTLTPGSLTVSDSYVRFVAKNTPAKAENWQVITDSILLLTEQGLLDEQKSLRALIDEQGNQRKELYGTISELHKEQEKVTIKLNELDSRHNDLKTRYEQLEASYQDLEQEKNSLTNQLEQEKTKLINQLQQSAADCQKQEQVIAALDQRYQHLEQKYTKLVAIHDALTRSYSYLVSQAISASFKPIRFSSLLLPVRLANITWIWIRRKRHAPKLNE